jgi:hypothetical protein
LFHLSLAYQTSKHFKQFIMCQNALALAPRSLVVGDAPASSITLQKLKPISYDLQDDGYKPKHFVSNLQLTWPSSEVRKGLLEVRVII